MLSRKIVIHLDWYEIEECLKEKYGKEIAEKIIDKWTEWNCGDRGGFFHINVETLNEEYDDWVRLLATCLKDNGINLNEEVFIYAE